MGEGKIIIELDSSGVHISVDENNLTLGDVSFMIHCLQSKFLNELYKEVQEDCQSGNATDLNSGE